LNVYKAIATAIDKTVGLFSPKAELARMYYREQRDRARSASYAAAKTTRMTGAWAPTDSTINDIIGASSPAVRARVRQLVRDFPYFARAVRSLTDYTVGDGLHYQARITNAAGKLDAKKIQQAEDAFSFWADEADISKKLHYYEMMRLAKSQDSECGEFLIVERYRKQGRYIPYALQMIEPDWLSDNAQKTAAGAEIEQGIEYDPNTGIVLAAHITDPDGWGKAERIPADQIIHGFETLRPGQFRGITPFAAGVLLANDLATYMDATIDTAKMSAKYLAFVKTGDPVGRQSALMGTDSDTGQKIEEMENAIVEYLRQGEEVTIATNPNPGANFPPFVKLVLTMLSIVVGVPYEIISGDYQGLSYSNGKIVREDFKKTLVPLQTRHIRHFCKPTLRGFMDSAVLMNKLSFPNYFTNPAQYLKAEWQIPGMASLDPLREAKANADNLDRNLTSEFELAKARGRDLEDIYRERQIAKKLREKYGIEDQPVSTSVVNNPAAITGEDKEDGKAKPKK